jgi:hypothetical protein
VVRKNVVVLAAALLSGCTLREVLTAPSSGPVLVVEGVINATDSVQTVLVQRSELGGPTSGEFGATVVITDLDPHGCATPTVQLDEPIAGLAGTYKTSTLCPLTAGDRLTLRVTTQDGAMVTGATQVPGIGNVHVRIAGTTASLPGTMLTMDRTSDSMFVNAGLTVARALLVEAVRVTAGEDPTFSVATDTAAMTIPGNLVDPTGHGRTIFHAGCYYALTVAAMDTNYFDFVRSSTNPLTGQGFINHLNGAIGVFGSVASVPFQLKVTAPQTDPREGLYQMNGRVRGVSVNVTWDVYRDPLAHDSTAFEQGDGFFAFVDGTWVGGPLHTSVNGSFPGSAFIGQMFGDSTAPPAYTGIPLDSPDSTYHFFGARAAPHTPFPVLVTPGAVFGAGDSVSVVQTSSP